MFYNEDGVKFTSINSVPKDRVIFRSEYSLIYGGTETSEEPYLYGIYPYSTDNAQNGETLTLTVPATQTAVEGSFARGAFPSIGRSKDTNIAFYNVCGGIRFTVGQSGITKIIITGNNNEVLVGKVNVQFDGEGHPAVSEVIEGSTSITLNASNDSGFEAGKWYYISTLPVKLTKGFFVKLYKVGGKEGEKVISSSLEVKRSSFGSIAEIDKGIILPGTSIYTAADFLTMLAIPQTEGARDTTYTIMNDIDFTGYSITYDNSFKGNFYANIDGNGKKFTNYTASADMIQKLYGTFKNMTIESGSFILEPDHSCGIFIEQVEFGGVAENLVNKAEITGDIVTTTTFHQGAFCGLCRGVMKNCKNYGNATINLIQGKKSYHYRFGGITAVADAKACNFNISGCVNTGKISMVNADGYRSETAKVYAGGLVGQRNEGDIKNCSTTGELDLTELNFNNVFVGGLIGFQKAGYSGEAFQNCTINANVKASFVNATSTTANPLANASMIVASVGDAGVTFGGAKGSRPKRGVQCRSPLRRTPSGVPEMGNLV